VDLGVGADVALHPVQHARDEEDLDDQHQDGDDVKPDIALLGRDQEDGQNEQERLSREGADVGRQAVPPEHREARQQHQTGCQSHEPREQGRRHGATSRGRTM
jgi:hypothetical protein